jgi:hypothetical protein
VRAHLFVVEPNGKPRRHILYWTPERDHDGSRKGRGLVGSTSQFPSAVERRPLQCVLRSGARPIPARGAMMCRPAP